MIRHLNATSRQTILSSHVAVTIRAAEANESPVFDIDYQLGSYAFASDARVRLEAWRELAVQRWDLGTVGAPQQAERRLTDVPISSQFRLCVVADGSGKMLGMSGSIKPKLPGGSLLPLALKQLGGEVWRINFGDGDGPELVVNSEIEAISEIVRNDSQFRSLIMPQVLRSVLTQIIVVDQNTLDDDEGEWWIGWLRLARSLATTDIPSLVKQEADESKRQEALDWIDQVVEAFARQRVNASSAYAAAVGVSR